MVIHVETAFIGAPPERVFDYRLDARNLPLYNPDVSRVELLDGGPVTAGSPVGGPSSADTRYAFRLRLAPWLHCRCCMRVTRAERPRRIEFAIDSIMDAHELCTFEPAGAGQAGTRLRFSIRVRGTLGPLAPLLRALVLAPQMRRELRMMKAQIESQ